jgi:Secretion system C-terminal sorting domain
MKMKFIGILWLLVATTATAQNWNAYPAGSIGVAYANGPMIATVTRVNTTMNSGTPMFTTSTSPDCYIAAGSLALNAGFFNSYIANSSRIQVDIDFSNGGTIAGTCNSATFTIRDINSGESFTDFLDIVEISGIDGTNAALPAANIVVTPPTQVTVTTVGTSKKIVGHNAASEVVTGGPYASSPCNTTSITVTPPANTPLKSIRIIYRPAVGTNSSNAYFSVGTHPAVQYISISNLSLTPTGGGCTVLPVSLRAFYARTEPQTTTLHWEAADIGAAPSYLLEKSENAHDFTTLALIDAAGHAAWTWTDAAPSPLTYYRLTEVDINGDRQSYAVLAVTRDATDAPLFRLFPNPSAGRLHLETLLPGENAVTVANAQGQVVWQAQIEGIRAFEADCELLLSGIYFVSLHNAGQVMHQKVVVNR